MQRIANRLGLAGGVLVLAGALLLAAGCGDKKAGLAGSSGSVAYEAPSNDYYAPDSLGGNSGGYASYDSGYGSTASYGGGQSHTVVKGDTLYSLARAYYNDQSKWKAIYEANRGTISDPNRLSVGQQLTIP